MLPTVKTTAIAGITALAVALTAAAPAQALGKNERKFIEGAAVALLVNRIILDAQRQPVAQPHYVQPRPVYTQPQPVQVYQPQPAVRTISIYQTTAAQAFNSYSRAERRVIQTRLAQMGYYRSGIDGAFGPGTYNAAVAYARDSGGDISTRAGAFGVYDALIY